eukprot:SAG31_NODE_45522_length_258_cov_0.981132_1_plen_32_part_01
MHAHAGGRRDAHSSRWTTAHCDSDCGSAGAGI